MTGERRPRIAQLRVEDREYPRNQRVRDFLTESGFDVRVIERAKGGNKIKRVLKDLSAIARDTRGCDAMMVAEFSLSFVPFAWLVSRFRRIPLVVDGFVGQYETAIEDWGLASPRSFLALKCRFIDAMALRLADLYLIDTEVRAAALRRPGGTPVLGLPVGAPAWIGSEPVPPREEELRVLYFGGNIPLHGLPLAFEALSKTTEPMRLDLVFSGPREPVDAIIERLGIGDRCIFHPAMPHRELIDAVHRSDAMLGIFGDSTKARTVVANKVWQGLAAGRTTITRRTPATEEVSAVSGDLLVLVDDADSLAAALDDLARRPTLPEDTTIATRLESWVDERFAALADWLRSAVR